MRKLCKRQNEIRRKAIMNVIQKLFGTHSDRELKRIMPLVEKIDGVRPPTPSYHRLQCGLPGYLILFAPHTFEPQRQLKPSKPPSPLVFLRISTHFTATLGIPLASTSLKNYSFGCSSVVKPRYFTSNLQSRLRSLYTQ